MKKIYICLLLSAASASAFCQETFNGNTRTGFAGPVGQGSLEITNDASSYTFKFTKGAADLNDAVVIYVDSKTGGFSSTAGFQDNNDGLRTATSGYSSATNKSILTFPTGFLPDYAIAVSKDFAAIFELVNGGPISFNYVGSGDLTPLNTTMAPVYTFTATKAQLGIISGSTFKFLGAYIATSAFRSNEFIGDAGPAANPGNTDYTATTFNTYIGGVLPLQFSNFALRKSAGNAVQLSWKTSLEQNVSHFEILRSSNGLAFTSIATITARNTAVDNFYTTTDITPAKANNFYKIMIVDKDGKKSISEILKMNLSSNAAEMLAYQSGNTIKVNLSNPDKGNYAVRLSNAQGQQVFAGTILHNGGNTSHTLNIKTTLLPSVYHVTLINNASRLSSSFIIQ